MKFQVWIARLLIAFVVFFNLQCSLVFMISPERFTASFDLVDATGIYMIQGLGLLFLMWNVPYVIALLNPIKYRVSLIESIIMQTIGVAGETILLATVPPNYQNLHDSVMRFIYFDGGGLVLLLGAWLLTRTRIYFTKP